MGTITTITVGQNSQPLAPAPVAGQTATVVTVINLDTANTVNLGSQPSQLALALGPLASVTLTAPVFAAAATEQLKVGVIPGGSNYSPGSLTITGPVTAEITGTVDADVTGTVDIAAGSVTFTNDTIDVVGAGGYVVPGETGTVYANAAAYTVPAGPSGNPVSVGPFDVSTYASLDFSFAGLKNSSAASGTAMCAVITFQWEDSSGNVLGYDTIAVCQAQYAAGILPCRGEQVTLSVFNPGTTGSLTFPEGDILIDGSFRTVDALKFTASAEFEPTFSGLILLGSNPPAYSVNGWLANINQPGLTAGDLYMWLLPMYNGPVSGYYQIVTDALDNDAVIIDLAYATVGSIVAGTNNNAILQNLPSAISSQAVSFYAPPSQLAFVVKPSSDSTGVFLTLTGQG